MTSDFGRGYATCLRQFVNHTKRLSENVALYRQMHGKHSEDGLFSDESAIEMWANGASDHLYELIRPKRGISRSEWEQAKGVQARALDIGHGYRPTSKATLDEALLLLARAADLLDELVLDGHAVVTLDEAMATDRELGLIPDAGSWSCALDLERNLGSPRRIVAS